MMTFICDVWVDRVRLRHDGDAKSIGRLPGVPALSVIFGVTKSRRELLGALEVPEQNAFLFKEYVDVQKSTEALLQLLIPCQNDHIAESSRLDLFRCSVELPSFVLARLDEFTEIDKGDEVALAVRSTVRARNEPIG
ncbi:hypothetical protein ColLi_02610 [Colletotrichum liriopes]|uniref:Uncharacterized protein n=1 Tax=Colletotrichum liriopes TaxID=708192 RepID=A0AA37GFW5_9PEZI|nr:hypothetical protein ColLi_02610 [Colletotrichum liriopes]